VSVPVIVVAGFLGAGKTTLLRRLVADPVVGPRLAVLVNELGALGIDEELIRSATTSSSLRTVQIDSGCVCCALQGDLKDALAELARPTDRPPPGHIFLETSGAAIASEVRFRIGVVGPYAGVHAEAVITVVDAAHFRRARAEAEELFTDQLECADLVLLNKIDLVAADEVERAIDEVRAVALRATVLPVVSSEVDPKLLVGAVPLERDAPAAHAHRENAGHGFGSISIDVARPVVREALETMLEELAERVYRTKGVVDSDEGALVVQSVGDQIEIEPLPEAMAAARRRLIFIGQRLDAAALHARVAALLDAESDP
jgi:cobalamin biosynthesis protein CobW